MLDYGTTLDIINTFTEAGKTLVSGRLISARLEAYLAYYDVSSATASERKYKYVATSDLGMDDDSLRANKGYWFYSNEDGNLTLPSIGGSLANETYVWEKLRFANGTSELNITDAGSEGWLTTTLKYTEGGVSYTFKDICGSTLPPLACAKTTISSWEGIFIKSNVDNLTLIRQN